MLFNSLRFAVFFAAVFLLYWALPHRLRWPLLLAASLCFYMSMSTAMLPLLLYTVLVSYLAALLLERQPDGGTKKLLLAATVVLTLLPLLIYKYLGFFLETAGSILSVFGLSFRPAALRLMLPVGISFYTFQALGYVIDVSRGRLSAERNFGVFALFVCFFPQLSSGPISRAGSLLPQLREEHTFDYSHATYALRLMVWGFFNKMVIADNLVAFTDRVFGDLYACTGFTLVLGLFLFSLAIYCDFRGYTDIARGCAMLLGIELNENFRSPYLASSIRDHWNRWHTSLSTWFRDYLYIPLGGSRVSRARHCVNLMITFLVSGLWHGASWNYVIWGGLHGLALVVETLTGFGRGKEHSGLRYWLGVLYVNVFLCFGWIFFRPENMAGSLYVLTHVFEGISAPAEYLRGGLVFLNENLHISKKLLLAALAVLTAYDYASMKTDVIRWLGQRPAWLRYGVYVLLGAMILLCHHHADVSFIYFQF